MAGIKVSKKRKKEFPSSIIETHSGIMFDVMNPRADHISIFDIAHALSNQGRYGGHASGFYSVAEHSVLVMFIAAMLIGRNKKLAPNVTEEVVLTRLLGALLHDASEAYLVDIPTPVKKHLSNYVAIEKKLMGAIFQCFEIDVDYDDSIIHTADRIALKKEASVLLPSGGTTWPAIHSFNDEGFDMSMLTVRCLKPKQAKLWFLYAYFSILHARNNNPLTKATARKYKWKFFWSRVFG